MISILRESDLPKLQQLQQKKNMAVRFVMNGCHWCEQTQPMWDDATKRASLSSNDAMAEIESSFLDHFKQSMSDRQDFSIQGFPTIIMIHGKKVMEHKGRDTNSIITALKQIKKLRNPTRKRKSKRFK